MTHIEEMQQSRWELSALIGPCPTKEATLLLEQVAEAATEILRGYGAAWSIQRVEDD